ncbi:MAG: hypothetical protein LBE91_14055 [Tannerella sp.]|nr:hypothetical protein [Tannerella sp.]
MLKSSRFWIAVSIIIVLLGILTFRPIVNPKEKDCTKIEGTLDKYQYHTENQDIVIKIKGDEKIYYLNRVANEAGILHQLDSLLNRQIVLYAVNHWTLLDPKNTLKHVARVTDNVGNIIFTEY